MKIEELNINSYGKVKNRRLKFNDNINIVYGKNESGKSTILSFLTNSLYGISKNKNGKEISDFERYKPWIGENFSGKVIYKLDNDKKIEVQRDFSKKNPKIFDESNEEISKNYTIDKTKGNQFFYEQTGIDEKMFYSTLVVNQKEVKIDKVDQNLLMQKVANLMGTGEDTVSYKKSIERIDRKILNEIGTDKSREKPINVLERQINEIQKEQEELEVFTNSKFEIDEIEKKLTKEVENLQIKMELVSDLEKNAKESIIQNEKIELQTEAIKEKTQELTIKTNEVEKLEEELNSINLETTKISKKSNMTKLIIVGTFVILFSIIQYLLVSNVLVKNFLLLIIPIYLVFVLKLKISEKNQEKLVEDEIKTKKYQLITKIELINKEIDNIQEALDRMNNQNIENRNRINNSVENLKKSMKERYNDILDSDFVDKMFNSKDIYIEKVNLQREFDKKRMDLYTLALDKKNIEPALDKLPELEELLNINKEQYKNLLNKRQSMELAKQVIVDAYEEMKKNVSPKLADDLSENISKITGDRYSKLLLNEENGIMAEVQNGEYVGIERLSVGTIDQIYLSLRLAVINQLSDENMPIILDEAFAYYDEERLENILKYLNEIAKNKQVIIFTCTNREKILCKEKQFECNIIEI